MRSGTGAGFIARVDFAYPEAKLAIEIDGEHHAQRKQWRSDLARQNRLVLLGWRFLRFSRREAQGDPRVLIAIEKALGESGDHVVTARLPKRGTSGTRSEG